MNLIQQLEQEEIARLGKTIPAFAPGDTVVVQVKVKEGTRERLQAYEGVVTVSYTHLDVYKRQMQQMNLAFAVDRLEKLNMQLVAATVTPLVTLGEAGWDSKLLAKLGEIWVAMPSLAGHADELPEIASLLLTNFVERGEVQPLSLIHI